MVTINGILMVLALSMLAFAIVSRFRLWHYKRRLRRQEREEFALIAERDGLRAQCEALFWGGQP
jgi:hypothetical protein